MGILGILIPLGLLILLAHRGWSILLPVVCGTARKDGDLDRAMAATASALVALFALILLGSFFGSF